RRRLGQLHVLRRRPTAREQADRFLAAHPRRRRRATYRRSRLPRRPAGDAAILVACLFGDAQAPETAALGPSKAGRSRFSQLSRNSLSRLLETWPLLASKVATDP